jgi:hypothetical protein
MWTERFLHTPATAPTAPTTTEHAKHIGARALFHGRHLGVLLEPDRTRVCVPSLQLGILLGHHGLHAVLSTARRRVVQMLRHERHLRRRCRCRTSTTPTAPRATTHRHVGH